MDHEEAGALYDSYDKILGQLMRMIQDADQWTIQ